MLYLSNTSEHSNDASNYSPAWNDWKYFTVLYFNVMYFFNQYIYLCHHMQPCTQWVKSSVIASYTFWLQLIRLQYIHSNETAVIHVLAGIFGGNLWAETY
jgi:hypothetical protein